MRTKLFLGLVLVCLLLGGMPAWGDTDTAVKNVLGTLQGVESVAPPLVIKTDQGHIRFLDAPVGGEFATDSSLRKVARPPEDVARGFVLNNGGAFGIVSGRVDFSLERLRQDAGRTYVRMRQTYKGLPVFGAQVNVQVNENGAIDSVLSDILRDTALLDSGNIAFEPAIAPGVAADLAAMWASKKHEAPLGTLAAPTPRKLCVYAPSVVNAPTGSVCLAWEVSVFSLTGDPIFEVVLVDAATGKIAFHYPRVHTDKYREVYDAALRYDMRGTLARAEGDPPTDIEDVDNCYDYLGDVYDLYADYHGRDSIDDRGMPLVALVRLPIPNAYWMGDYDGDLPEEFAFLFNRMTFGTGFVVRDVIGHEYTHGVTSYESDLIYAYESGAINESFSDIWGEFADLRYYRSKGEDYRSEVWWLMGEDIQPFGAIRNMKNPPAFGDPDRYLGAYWWTSPEDNGGVHTNSGVGNKLAYLLTDGDRFNRHTVRGMGIRRVAELFYEVQTNILTESAGYYDLYGALMRAAKNLGFTQEEQDNVRAACNAVAITTDTGRVGLSVFRAMTEDGVGQVGLMWENPDTEWFDRVVLVRNLSGFPEGPADGVSFSLGSRTSYIDGADVPLTLGLEAYYGLFALDMTGSVMSSAFASAVVGAPSPSFLTETFTAGTGLSYSQIVLRPTGDWSDAYDSGMPRSVVGYDNYAGTFEQNVSAFPVDSHGAIYLPMADRSSLWYMLDGSVPFFGALYSAVIIFSNGSLGFIPAENQLGYWDEGAGAATLNNHFAMPRISFLFSDLSPSTGGTIWMKELHDRLVVTFNHVPEWMTSRGNSVQMELFFNGQVRMTYGHVSAQRAIVGLSDGRGVPVSPFTGEFARNDLSSLDDPPGVEILPIPNQFLYEIVDPRTPPYEFEIVARSRVAEPAVRVSFLPKGAAVPPDRENYEEDGYFYTVATMTWRPETNTAGLHNVLVTAEAAGETVSQDVMLYVYETRRQPEALNVAILEEGSELDPAGDRTVDVQSTLQVSYDYYHPGAGTNPGWHAQGEPIIHWYRNGALVSGLINSTVLPSAATRPGDEWSFSITPRSVLGQRGATLVSPFVTIVGAPTVTSIAPNEATVEGGEPVLISGNYLAYPEQVYFGGVKAQRVRSVSLEGGRVAIEAISPVVFAPGLVDVRVLTSLGEVTVPEAFTFITEDEDGDPADVNMDGVVDAADAQIVIKAILGEGSRRYNADVDGDGTVTSADLQLVVSAALNR